MTKEEESERERERERERWREVERISHPSLKRSNILQTQSILYD